MTSYDIHEKSLVAGPALPPNYKSSSSESSDSDEDSSSLYEGGNQESEEDDTGPPARSVTSLIQASNLIYMGCNRSLERGISHLIYATQEEIFPCDISL